MPQAVHRHGLMDFCLVGGRLDGLLDDRVAHVVTPHDASATLARTEDDEGQRTSEGSWQDRNGQNGGRGNWS
jgi:hypothetical protein